MSVSMVMRTVLALQPAPLCVLKMLLHEILELSRLAELDADDVVLPKALKVEA